MPMPDLAFSMQMRDIVDKMVKDAVDRERPRYRYAKVQAIHRATMKCDVIFNGETGTVRVNMGSIQPSAVNQIVRVEGIGTDKFITDVIGTPFNGSRYGVIEPKYASGAPRVIWEGDTVATGPYMVVGGWQPRAGQAVTTFPIPGHENILFPVFMLDGLDDPVPPTFYPLQFKNNWSSYSNLNYTNMGDYDPGRYTRTATGIVKLAGLVAGGNTAAGTVVATLPEGFRPAGNRMFVMPTSHSIFSSEICVKENGDIIVFANVANGWISLDHITFPSSDVAPNAAWTTPTPAQLGTGWQHYMDAFPNDVNVWSKMGYWVDAEGILWERGLGRKVPSPGNGDPIMATPGITQSKTHHRPAVHASGPGFSYRQANFARTDYGHVVATGSAYISLDGMPHIPDSSPMNNRWFFPATQNGWNNYGDPYTQLAYMKTPSGLVFMRGLIKTAQGLGNGLMIYPVPVGWRPKYRLLRAATSNSVAGRIDITPAGDIAALSNISGAWTSLDSMHWVAEQ